MDLLELTEDTIWGKGIKTDRVTIDEVVQKMLRKRSIEDRLLKEGGDFDSDGENEELPEELRRLTAGDSAVGLLGKVMGAKKELEAVFRLLDSDGSGQISVREVQEHVSVHRVYARHYSALLFRAQGHGWSMR